MRLALLLALLVPATASAGSLYEGPAPRPGPDVLYAPPVAAPQLENTGIWQAEPILVSGASAYRKGEFVYQDFLYDDLGASGAYRYPDDERYAGNAADIVELRVRPLTGETAIRLTYNSMIDPTLVAATIALGSSPVARAFPHGANASAPAQVFVTVHGGGADAVDALTGLPLGPGLVTATDLARRQVEVRIPHAVFDPTAQPAVRIAAAAGLWDAAAGAYVPQTAAAFFNVAFRFNERGEFPGAGFRASNQSAALAEGDLSRFYATVDFDKLATGADDDLHGQPAGVPRTGFMNRILVSATEERQGRGDVKSHSPGCEAPCALQYSGRLQPYSLYVPDRPPPLGGYGLTLDLHGCGQTHNVGFGSVRQRQLGDRHTGSIVLTPEARGDCYWYFGHAGADVFEAWADVARRYPLDPGYAAIAGTSMGGYGAYKLAAAYPDLFAAAAAVAPCPSSGVAWSGAARLPGGISRALVNLVGSLRHVPTITWLTTADRSCEYAIQDGQADVAFHLDRLGYAYDTWTFEGLEHKQLANQALGQSQPLADFLGSSRAVRDPSRVTFVLNALTHEPARGLGADHAYWLSGVELRNPGVRPPVGTIDVLSRGFGADASDAAPIAYATRVLEGGPHGPLPYILASRARSEPRAGRPTDRLDVTASNVRRATIHVARARVSCSPRVEFAGDGPLDLKLDGCTKTFRLRATCHRRPTFRVGTAIPAGERRRSVGVTIRGQRLRLRRGFARVDLRRRPEAIVRVRIVSVDSRFRTVVHQRTHRWCR